MTPTLDALGAIDATLNETDGEAYLYDADRDDYPFATLTACVDPETDEPTPENVARVMALARALPHLAAALALLERWLTWERETFAALEDLRHRLRQGQVPNGDVLAALALPPSPTEATRALLHSAGRSAPWP